MGVGVGVNEGVGETTTAGGKVVLAESIVGSALLCPFARKASPPKISKIPRTILSLTVQKFYQIFDFLSLGVEYAHKGTLSLVAH